MEGKMQQNTPQKVSSDLDIEASEKITIWARVHIRFGDKAVHLEKKS